MLLQTFFFHKINHNGTKLYSSKTEIKHIIGGAMWMLNFGIAFEFLIDGCCCSSEAVDCK
jgi:hypothetical protein